jgi:hypothetical protein
MHTKQHGEIYIIFAGLYGFYWFLSVHVRAHTSPSYDSIFWNRKERPASEKTNISVRVAGFWMQIHRGTTSPKGSNSQLFIWSRYFSRRLSTCTTDMGSIWNKECWAIPWYICFDSCLIFSWRIRTSQRDMSQILWIRRCPHVTGTGLAGRFENDRSTTWTSNTHRYALVRWKRTTRGHIHDITEACQSQQHIYTRIRF